jgi:MFS transporter, ACS family, D-galactonate transporter
MPRFPNDSRTLRTFAPALFLLAISFLINYIDRGNISIAGPLVKSEFELSDWQLGRLFSTFFVTYTAMQFIMGWMVDRFDANRILAAGFLLWSVATAVTGVAHGFVMLLVMRFILGIGESVALPCGSKILAHHLPEQYRGFASGALMSSLKCGNAVGTLGAGLLMAEYGWRPVFISIGLVSLLWLPAWQKWMPRGSGAHADDTPRDDSAGPSFWGILSHRSFWGTSAGHFCSNYLFYFMITWLPSYLVRERHLSLTTMAVVGSVYYAVDAGSAMLAGWIQDVALRRGYTATVVRKSVMVIGFSLAALSLIGCALAGGNSYLPWLLAAGIGCGMTGPGLYTFPQTLAGPGAVGKWYGWQNGFANLAGVIGPALTGLVVQETGNFFWPFAITAAICVFGVFDWQFIVGRVEPVNWAQRSTPAFVNARVKADLPL